MAGMDTPLITVQVSQKRVVAQDIVCLDLRALDGQDLPPFSPGAHVDVHVPGGLIRQYSLLSDSTVCTDYQIAVLREVQSRGGSQAIHDLVQAGDLLQISAPRNHFGLVPAARTLLFAGGIGITPLLCMARQLHATKVPFQLHYSSRSQVRAAFLDQLQQFPADAVALYFDDDSAKTLDIRGVLSAQPLADTHVFVCGPAGYIDYVCGQVRQAGLPDAQVHVERFALGEADRPVITDQDVAFEVQLASTGEIFQIPADESITSALDRQGVFIPVSCEEGICGTCLTGITEGVPDHRDTYLTDEEHAANDQFTPCCSRARTPRLILDL